MQFSGIESIEIGENIHEIGYCAFYGCEHLKSLVIPENVTSIGWGIVTAHEGFEGIVCNAPGFHVENDALIDDRSGEMLCCWTTQKDYVVPECVKRIADFSMNDFVETITVKQYVEIMDSDTFAGNSNLKKTDFLGGYGAYFESGKSVGPWLPVRLWHIRCQTSFCHLFQKFIQNPSKNPIDWIFFLIFARLIRFIESNAKS